jgi:hypothetical protein
MDSVRDLESGLSQQSIDTFVRYLSSPTGSPVLGYRSRIKWQITAKIKPEVIGDESKKLFCTNGIKGAPHGVPGECLLFGSAMFLSLVEEKQRNLRIFSVCLEKFWLPMFFVIGVKQGKLSGRGEKGSGRVLEFRESQERARRF